MGRALLAVVARTLHERDCASLWLSTLPGNPAQAWYNRLGGDRLGAERYMIDGIEVIEVRSGWTEISHLFEQ